VGEEHCTKYMGVKNAAQRITDENTSKRVRGDERCTRIKG
jgi:hypothetical protein